MLDQFRALGSGYDQWRGNPCPVGLRNGLRQAIVVPAGQRQVYLPQQRSAAFAISAYNDSVGIKKVSDRGAFPEELGIGSNVEGIGRGGVPQDDLANPIAGVNRNRALFDDYLVAVDSARYAPGHGLNIREIGIALLSWGRPHCNENDSAGANRLLQIVGKTQPAAAMTLQQLGKKVLMNGNLTGIQSSQLLMIVVNQDNFVAEVGETPPCHQSHVS